MFYILIYYIIHEHMTPQKKNGLTEKQNSITLVIIKYDFKP